MSNNVDLVLSNPWVDQEGKVHDVGQRVSVPADLAERLVTGGTGVPATKSDAESVAVAVEPASKRK